MKTCILRLYAFVSVLSCLLLLQTASGADMDSRIGGQDHEILILNSYHPGFHWSDNEQNIIVEWLDRAGIDSNPYIKYMDARNYPGRDHIDDVRRSLERKYGGKKFDLVVALDDPALFFSVKYHDRLFGNAPIVFCGVSNFRKEMLKGDKHITGVVSQTDPAGTIGAMLKLHPLTKQIFVLHDYTTAGMAIYRDHKAFFPLFENRVLFRENKNLPIKEIISQLERLPEDSLVLLLSYANDSTGRSFDVQKLTEIFSSHCPVPVYGHADVRFGHGIVGGKLISSEAVAGETTKLIARIIKGEDAGRIPIVRKQIPQFMFDGLQLERFHIPISSLPKGSVVINRPVSFYEANKTMVFAAAAIFLFLLAVIAVLILYIRQRRRMAQALKKSEAKYLDLYENAPDMYYSIDVKTAEVKECNETFLRATGYSRDEVIGRPIFDFYDNISREKAERYLRQFSEGSEISDEERIVRCKDGRRIFVSLNMSFLKDKAGNVVGSRSIWRDITERKHMEDILRVRLDLFGYATSHSLGDLLQKTLDEVGRLVDSPIGFYHFVEPNQRTISLQAWSTRTLREFCTAEGKGMHYSVDQAGVWVDCVRRREPVIHNNYLSLLHRKGLPDGHAAVVRELVVPIMRSGKIVAIMGVGNKPSDYNEKDVEIVSYLADVAWEIAEHKRADAERLDLKERLHRSEKMEALGKLAGGVAHDLNNILGVSMAYAELLKERLPRESPLRTYADNILVSTEKTAAIIQDMLTLARRGVSVSKIVVLNDIVSAAMRSPEFGRLKEYYPAVIFKVELGGNLLNIKGSPLHLEKTVFNLISNAAEAVSGRGEVTVRTENRYLDKEVRGYDEVKEGDYVVITVSDDGRGVPETDLGKIFEPFYTKKSMGRSGTGLGLSIVWGTVKDHDGYIDLESTEGRGSAFTLYFPVTREKAEEEEPERPVEQYMGQGESVLVVDDVAEQRELATLMLSRLGYKCHALSSGEEAVEYLRNNKADILVLDMIMEPGIDGLDTYRRIIEINPKQKAVIVSGFAETERVREAQRLGAGPYVKKPYVLETIGVALRDELNR